MRSRAWVFTQNNYEGLLDWEDFESAGATYLSYQEEVGENGTPHLQGFVYFKTLKGGKQVQDLVPGAWHAPAHAPKKAIEYTQKSETSVGGALRVWRTPVPRQAFRLDCTQRRH